MTTDAYQDAVQKLMNYMNDTVIFAKEQLPDVAQQMLIYGAEISHMWMIGYFIAAIISFIFMILCIISFDSEVAGICLTSFALLIGFSILAGYEYSTILEIKDAPKLYIMEQLASKLKATK